MGKFCPVNDTIIASLISAFIMGIRFLNRSLNELQDFLINNIAQWRVFDFWPISRWASSKFAYLGVVLWSVNSSFLCWHWSWWALVLVQPLSHQLHYTSPKRSIRDKFWWPIGKMLHFSLHLPTNQFPNWANICSSLNEREAGSFSVVSPYFS